MPQTTSNNDQDFKKISISGITLAPTLPSDIIAESKGKVARTAVLATVLGATAATNVACGGDDEPTPITKPEEPKAQDTPEARAAYMADVKPAILGGGIATMDYDALFNGYGYSLQPKARINLQGTIDQLEDFSSKNGTLKEELAFIFYYNDNESVRIAWLVPYNDLIELKSKNISNITLNVSQFNKYIVKSDIMPNGGNPNATVAKNAEGYLEINIGFANNSRIAKTIGRWIQVINATG